MMENTMGLSSVTAKELRFAKHFYNNPDFYYWHEWFAWYPVRIVTFKEIEMSSIGVGTFYVRRYSWAWLKKISRRKVVDYLDKPGAEGAGKKVYYEHTTLMDLLKNGH